MRLKRVFLVNSFIRNKLITSKINERQKFLAFEQLQWLGINIINFTNINFHTCSYLSENSNNFFRYNYSKEPIHGEEKIKFWEKKTLATLSLVLNQLYYTLVYTQLALLLIFRKIWEPIFAFCFSLLQKVFYIVHDITDTFCFYNLRKDLLRKIFFLLSSLSLFFL